MKLLKLIEDFEKGVYGLKEKKDLYFQHKSEGKYIKLAFNVDSHDEGTYYDVFVHESKEIILTEEVSLGGVYYQEGTKLLVEVNYETPTLYGHQLSHDELLAYIEENFEEIYIPRVFIGNEDDEWQDLEDYI